MNKPHLQQKTDELMARGPTVHTHINHKHVITEKVLQQ